MDILFSHVNPQIQFQIKSVVFGEIAVVGTSKRSVSLNDSFDFRKEQNAKRQKQLSNSDKEMLFLISNTLLKISNRANCLSLHKIFLKRPNSKYMGTYRTNTIQANISSLLLELIYQLIDISDQPQARAVFILLNKPWERALNRATTIHEQWCPYYSQLASRSLTGSLSELTVISPPATVPSVRLIGNLVRRAGTKSSCQSTLSTNTSIVRGDQRTIGSLFQAFEQWGAAQSQETASGKNGQGTEVFARRFSPYFPAIRSPGTGQGRGVGPCRFSVILLYLNSL